MLFLLRFGGSHNQLRCLSELLYSRLLYFIECTKGSWDPPNFLAKVSIFVRHIVVSHYRLKFWLLLILERVFLVGVPRSFFRKFFIFLRASWFRSKKLLLLRLLMLS